MGSIYKRVCRRCKEPHGAAGAISSPRRRLLSSHRHWELDGVAFEGGESALAGGAQGLPEEVVGPLGVLRIGPGQERPGPFQAGAGQ